MKTIARVVSSALLFMGVLAGAGGMPAAQAPASASKPAPPVNPATPAQPAAAAQPGGSDVPDLSGVWGPRFVQSLSENAPWLPEAYKAFKSREGEADPIESCKPAGVPRVMDMAFPFEIVQTPKIVYILAEYDQVVRRVFINGTHPKDMDPSWYGHSIGHWEGRTLVVDTVGFNDQTWLDMRGHSHSEEMRLIEKFTRSDEGKTLTHEITIDDPKTYSKPWGMTKTHTLRPDMKINEFICETAEP